MSLINEALKRAQEAQGQATRTADRDIELRPVEPGTATASRRTVGWVLPSVITAAALLAIFCIYQAVRPSGSQPVQARTPVHNSQPPVAPASSPAPPETVPTKSPVIPAANVSAAPLPQERTVPAPPPEHTNSNSVITAAGSELTATAPPPAPKPVLRLQGIVFHPTRPSAVINGKTVFVGDKVTDKRVIAIDADTVTLAGSGETNVLTLP
jgi:hypothetical protein